MTGLKTSALCATGLISSLLDTAAQLATDVGALPEASREDVCCSTGVTCVPL